MTRGYVIEPSPLVLRDLTGGATHRAKWDATIVLVGCGGTGSQVVDKLCKLLIGRRAQLFLCDPDRVEPKNVGRQAFWPADVGRFKVDALAERAWRHYGRLGIAVGASARPYDAGLHGEVFRESSALKLLIGAVDNAAARRAITATLASNRWGNADCWWLDAGNSRDSGQVIVGNVLDPAGLRGACNRASGRCRALPAPSLRRPELLEAPPEPEPGPRLDCAAAVALGDQSPTINGLMADWLAIYVRRLLDGTLAWSETLIDAEAGTTHSLPVDPTRLARQFGLDPAEVEPPLRVARGGKGGRGKGRRAA